MRFFTNKKKEKPKSEDKLNNYSIISLDNVKKLKDIICCQNVNPDPDDHIQIINGKKIFARTLYVSEMPRRSSFGYTFEPIFKFGNANTSVFIKPIHEGKAIDDINKCIINLDAERMSTNNQNRSRRLERLLKEAEGFSDAIDSGENNAFLVSILVTIFADSFEELEKNTDDLRNKAKQTNVILSISYANQEEAFLSNLPINNNKIGHYHLMDKFSLSTLFHYNMGIFGHSKGAVLGINKDTGELVCYDFFERSMNGYNVVISGTTRSGKSTLVKVLTLRTCRKNGIKFVSLDIEGEYGRVAIALGGINIALTQNGQMIINPFEIETELVLDKTTGNDIETLNLQSKINNIIDDILTMARGATPEKASLNDVARRIVKETVQECYNIKDIFEGDVDSLYETVEGVRRKKTLPTLSDWMTVLESDKFKKQYMNMEIARPQYEYLIITMKDYTRKYNGSRLYFDGQSTFVLSLKKYPFINFDLSALSENTEKPMVQTVVMNWMWETCFKKNSENPLKAEQLIAYFDETHHLLPYDEARRSLTSFYRRAAKKNVGIISATQNIQDYEMYKDCLGIFTNANTKILLRHDNIEREAAIRMLQISEREADDILVAPKGEILIKCGNTKATVQVHILPTEKEIIETDMNIRKEIEIKKQKRE